MLRILKTAFLYLAVLLTGSSLVGGAPVFNSSGEESSYSITPPSRLSSGSLSEPNPIDSKILSKGPTSVFRSPEFEVLTYRIHRVSSNRFCLTSRLINERVSLRLLQHGISPQKGEVRAGYPRLDVNISLNDSTFFITLDLSRMPEDKSGSQAETLKSVSWNRAAFGAHDYDLDVILDSLDHLLAIFLDRYLSANQSFDY